LLGARCGINGRNPEDGKDFKILAIVQQVLKVALLFPILSKKNSSILHRSVGQGSGRFSSLIRWGNDTDKGLSEQLQTGDEVVETELMWIRFIQLF
jgi:hypothetical protein